MRPEMDSSAVTWIFVGAVLLFVTVVVVIAQQYQQKAKAKQQGELKERLQVQARNFAADVQRTRALPTATTSIILKPGEAAFYSAPSALYETRAVRNYQAGHAGVRVAKGVWIGGTSGRSVSTQQWAKIDTGLLTVTNQRVIFDGGQQDRTIPLKKIVSVNAGLTAIELSAEGRQKTMVFDADNPIILAAVIRICCQVNSPSDLSEFSNINLQIE